MSDRVKQPLRWDVLVYRYKKGCCSEPEHYECCRLDKEGGGSLTLERGQALPDVRLELEYPDFVIDRQGNWNISGIMVTREGVLHRALWTCHFHSRPSSETTPEGDRLRAAMQEMVHKEELLLRGTQASSHLVAQIILDTLRDLCEEAQVEIKFSDECDG